ncbi:hypothetical protein KBY58_02270 [Cyanobium sp. HWJ4-Hawea]|nr:hypothetical protein [Cyanobium sp. HWJ4-Hawea]
MSINSNSFRQGFASDGFYGYAAGPFTPGTPIQNGHQRRTPIDPQLGANGYWTKIEAKNGSTTTVNTNTGKSWTIQVGPQ